MQINYNILELFPTPVYTTVLPVELSSVIPFFDNQEIKLDMDEDNYGLRSKDSYILNKPECIDLKNYILDNVKIYADLLDYDYNEYKLSQSWLSVKMPGQHHSAHTHPNSLISGVFYYGQTEDKTPAINFHKGILGVNVSYVFPKFKKTNKNAKYSSTIFSIEITPGLLVLFPSYLTHSVPLNKTNMSRYSLAFNVVPKVGFGDEASLTELLF